LKTAQIAVCADFRGLTVAEATAFRRELRGVGATALVVKNTLAKLASQQAFEDGSDSEVDKFIHSFNGQSLVVYSAIDPVSPAKILAKYGGEKGKIAVKGAMLEGRFLDAKGIDAVSKLPGREELLVQLLRLMNTPATRIVRLLSAPSTKVVRVINAQKEKLAEAA
jgi:large subunit ribosomal protein L10